MGNSKNKKVPKQRKTPNTSKCQNSSSQKENVPKNVKNKTSKPDPNDSIAISKQLLLKKNRAYSKRRSLTRRDKFCPNGKPIPSLAELEKMFEDSDDDDDNDQTLKTPIPKTCTTSTPEKQTVSISDDKLLSPTTINKISERVMGLIQNLSDPKELMEVVPLLPDVPPPPVIPPKKRKKPDVPYIVGCKDRPQVISKPNTNFCKGDDDYGVQGSTGDQEEEPQTKRAKKSKIPNYSKSIFNAHSDEIAERLTKDDAGSHSDASSDSNKTIEYDPTPFQNLRPHSFSPLPSTSKDSETFIKNDELFNESLKEINVTKEATPKKISKENDIQIIDVPYETIVIDDIDSESTEEQTTSQAKRLLLQENTTTKAIDTNVKPVEVSMPNSNIKMIDVPHETIIIDDVDSVSTEKLTTSQLRLLLQKNTTSSAIDTNVEPGEVAMPNDGNNIHNIPNDDCIIVPSSTKSNNHNDSNQPIVIDDEYSTIMDINTLNNEPIEIIDVDDVIAENKTFLDKFKNKASEKFNKINTVVDVPTTYRNSTTTQTPQKTVTPSIHINSNLSNVHENQISSQNIKSNYSLPTSLNEKNTESVINKPSSVPTSQRSLMFENILEDFFKHRASTHRNGISTDREEVVKKMNSLFNAFANKFQTPPGITEPPNRVCTTVPVSTLISNTQKDFSDLDHSTNITTTQQSRVQPATSEPTRNLGDCPICLDPLTSKGIASTICGHVFCLKCIQTSIKSNGKKCPTCRKALKGAGGGYHQLFL